MRVHLGPAVGDDDAGGHRGGHADPRLSPSGYMHGDPGSGGSSAYLNLFVASMLTLVLAGNFAVLFLGWELVGLCSYLLISFWFVRPTGRRGREEGLRGQPDRRLRVHGRPDDRVRRLRHAVVRRGVRGPGCAALRGAATAVGLLLLAGRGREVGADPAVRVAPRRHGGPDTGVRPDPRRHHGHRRRLPGGADRRDLRRCPRSLGHGGRRRRRRHRPARRHHRHRPERHQAGARLLHHQPARLHGHGGGRRRIRRRALPPA